MYTATLVEFLNMGGGEITVILAVVLLLFGGKKLPELARGLGKGIRDFKDASEGVKREIHRNINSVGIADDIDSVINDNNTSSKFHPEDNSGNDLNTSGSEGINLEKKTAVAEPENNRIEIDKTNL